GKKKDDDASSIQERSKIQAKYKWKTSHLYPNDQTWEKYRAKLVAAFSEIAKCKGTLKQGPKMVRICLDRVFDADKRLARLMVYANIKHDQDTLDTKYQGLKAIIEKIGTDFESATSFLRPEFLALPTKTIRAMIDDPRLSDYDQYLREILHSQPHVLSQQEEELLANVSLLKLAGYNIYSAFSASELEFPTVTDAKGNKIKLSQAVFVQHRISPNRAFRKTVFDAFFGTYEKYKSTFAQMLSAQVNANVVYARARKYESALDAALNPYDISPSVYHQMIKSINKHLPLLHRYLKLRQKLLGIKNLRYYDLYPSIVKDVNLKFPYEQAPALVAEAAAPMGNTYTEALTKAMSAKSGWVDVYPNKGKRSGAYMSGDAYDVHPYVLCNYVNNYTSLSTLAHEMGHAMHSYFSGKKQPYSKSDYPIFVAEVASTVNEAFLLKYLLKEEKDPQKQLFLLGQRLESFRTTIFRQAMFAEFELAIYRMAEANKPLTAEALSNVYLDLLHRYYGQNKKVVQIDKLFGIEWAYIPHFYYNYYVYQYVTGMTAATAIASKILAEEDPARTRYFDHLISAGGSDFPISLLKNAGVDLTTTEPYDIAMKEFETTLNDAEQLAAKLK
ncbi:MAG: oligoendopeptidase F, partial [Pseudomonadota bacterium]